MLIATTLLALLLTAPQQAPEVKLTAPIGGYSSARVNHVTGKTKNVVSAMLVINGTERPLQINSEGAFDAVFMASPGRNFVEVQAKGKNGEVAKASANFYAIVPNLDLQVLLYWDTNGTDVDLHVNEPSGDECFYGNRQTPSGGMLDVDDVDGYGPEVYTLASAPRGDYEVSVQYFSDNGHPQSLAVVDVILYPGTARESRVTFEKMLTKTGDRVSLGKFTVTESGRLAVKE